MLIQRIFCARRTGENISARHICDLIFRWAAASPTTANRSPIFLYTRARVRLYHGHVVNRLLSVLGVRTRRVKASLIGKFWSNRGLIFYNAIWKHTLLKLGDFSNFRSSHRTNLPQLARHLLAIQHFRFTGSLYQKIRMELQEIATIEVPSIIASCRN